MKRLFLYICALMLCLCTQSFAEANIDITVRAVDNFVTISAFIGEDNVNEQVVIEVKNSAGEMNFINQGYSDYEGKCTFSYYNKGDTDTYSVKVTAGGCGVELNESYMMLNKSTIGDIVDEWKKKTSADEIYAITEQYLAYIPFDATYHDMLSDKEKLYAMYVADEKAKVEDIEDVISHLNYYTFACLNSEQKNAELVKTMLADTKINKYLGIDALPQMDDDETVEALFDANDVESIYQDIANRTYTCADEVKSAYGAALLAKYVKDESVYANIEKVIKYYNDAGYIDVDMDEYSKSKKKTSIMTALKKKDVTTYDKFEEAFEAALEEASKGTSSGSSGGSGGGGGGGIVSPAAPVSKPQEEPVISEETTTAFVDMDGFDWAENAVYELKKLGVISGVSETAFEPMRSITRGEVVKMFTSLFKIEGAGDAKIPFEDLQKSHWSYPYVAAAYSAGMVSGKGDGYFGTNDVITRNEIIVLAYNFIKKYELAYDTVVEREFTDMVAPWAAEAASFCKKAGIVSGRTDNSFDGDASLTRAEAAVILYKVYCANNFSR